MADMVDSVVNFLLENLTQLLIKELKLQGGVKDQVRSLKNDLSLINAFLKNTEGKRYDDELVKQVVCQIRDVAYEAEDVIDTFIVTVTKHRRRSKLRKLIHSCDRAISFHEVAKQIESIENIKNKINDNRSKYGIEIAESSGGDQDADVTLNQRRRYVEEDHVVGFAHDTEALLKQLIEGGLQKLQRNVVSIIGMGGSGKTTLARKIYNNNRIKKHFDFLGWVYVSQKYKIRDLLLEILKGVTPMPKLKKFVLKDELKEELFDGLEAKYSLNKGKLKGTLMEDLNRIKAMNDEECKRALFAFLDPTQDENKLYDSLLGFVEGIYKKNGEEWRDMNDDELKSVLFACLKDKRYLIVMDDIWESKTWNEVSVAFPTNSNGSRILITSRKKEVALDASSNNNSIPPIPPYELPFLEEAKGQELFFKKVFCGGTCPPELVDLGGQIVKSCHGLPLAIVVLGGLLAKKEKLHRIWLKYIDNVNCHLFENRLSCVEILALSYNDLPPHLRPCFLYFGIYPKGYEIPMRQLIRLWTAEGFIQPISDRNLEDVAEEYLEELIDRSLIQVATKRLDGGVKTCRIHDLLQEFCISESAKEKFLEVCTNEKPSPLGKSRRISIHCTEQPFIPSNPCEPSSSRSVIGFGGVIGLKSPLDKGYYLKWLCENNKLVRVVELGNMGICCLIPKNIENLVLLRYLRISSGELNVIPNSICNLWNLETLDMRDSRIICLPKGIWKLQKLRHLYLGGPTSLPKTDNEAGLPNLQVLSGIAIDKASASLFTQARFPNVRKLYLYSLGVAGLLSNIHLLSRLQILKICNYCMLSSPSSFPSTLTKITLKDVQGLSPFDVGVLGSLTNLRILKMVMTGGGHPSIFNEINLNCDESSFRQLEVFIMVKMYVDWTMGKGAMPWLQRLVLDRCQFNRMPLDELRFLSALRDLEVLHPDQQLARRLQKLKVRDGCKLHVYPPLNPSPKTN